MEVQMDKVCGNFPPYCYKAFDQCEYAEDFINKGKFRLNCIRYCRRLEDESRRDPTEGEGYTKEPGLVSVAYVSPDPTEKTIWTTEPGYRNNHIELGNPVFLFCSSLPEVDISHMNKNFGDNIVKINEPRQLAEDIFDYFTSIDQNVLVRGCNVIYNKGEKLDKPLSNNERVDMSYIQKPRDFQSDEEFRIAVIKFNKNCSQECQFLDGEANLDCIYDTVKLNESLKYVSWCRDL